MSKNLETGIKKAVSLAVEGGWLPSTVSEWTDECVLKQIDFETWAIEEPMHDIISGKPLKPLVHKFEIYKALLDPLFWQALGKAMGWEEEEIEVENYHHGFAPMTKEKVVIKVWKSHWHRFIDHLASGGDAESFLSTLLT